jgi:hypothetical protein
MKKIAFVLFLIGVVACEKENIEKGVPVLTVEVEPNAVSRNEMKWIYISEPGGKLIDSDIVHAGSFTLNGDVVPELIDITVYTIQEFTGFKNHFLVTMRDVPSNRTMYFRKQPLFNPALVAGTANFEISNWHRMEFSGSSFFVSSGSPAFNFPSPPVIIEGSVAKGAVNMFADVSDLLIVGRRNGQRVYQRAENVSPGSLVKFDLEEFTPIDYRVSLSHTTTSGLVQGFKGNLRYVIGTPGYDLGSSVPTLPYIDGYDYYETVASHYDGQTTTYHKVGPRPTSIVFPQHKGNVISMGLLDFRYSTDVSYSYYAATFSAMTHPVQWQIIGGSPNFKIKFLPPELKQSFPSISLSYQFIELRNYLDGYSYEEQIEEFLDPSKAPKYFEQFRVTQFRGN